MIATIITAPYVLQSLTVIVMFITIVVLFVLHVFSICHEHTF
jgi:hypothetical protein